MKAFRIRILEDAERDLHQGKQFYEQQSPNLGDYFFDSVVSDIESLLIYAGIHNKQLGFYRMFAKRFPYAIYYDFDGETVTVVAVLAMRRNPVLIRDMLLGR